MYKFFLSNNRVVDIANNDFYSESSLHPDRVMKEHDLVYIVEGEWEIWQEDKCFTLKKDEVIILFAGYHHFGINGCRPNTRTMFIHVVPDRDSVIDAPQLEENTICTDVIIECKNNPDVKALFQKIIQAYWSVDILKEKKLALNFNLLLCELSIENAKKMSTVNNVVNAILKKMNTSISSFYCLDDAAKEFSMSKRNIMYLFKKYTGKTFHSYQLDLKLKIAYQIMKVEPDRTFKDIANYLGFYDEFHFSKQFKAKFGVSPSLINKM